MILTMALLAKFDDLYSLYPETPAEEALMDDYRLQLALYSVILEGSEMLKPEDGEKNSLATNNFSWSVWKDDSLN